MSTRKKLVNLWCEDQGQDIAEYAVMLAVILVIVIGSSTSALRALRKRLL
jgi:Flp pilus assembly pilin Flp